MIPTTPALFTVTITPTDGRGAALGKMADAELVFTDAAGPLAGLKLVGFGVWTRRDGSANLTVPARQYTVNGERRSFALLRPAADPATLDTLKAAILAAYHRHQDGPDRATSPEPTPVTEAPDAAAMTLQPPPGAIRLIGQRPGEPAILQMFGPVAEPAPPVAVSAETLFPDVFTQRPAERMAEAVVSSPLVTIQPTPRHPDRRAALVPSLFAPGTAGADVLDLL